MSSPRENIFVPADIIQDLVPAGRRNRPGFKIQGPRYLTIHDTGNRNQGADARAHGRYLQGEAAAARPVSWHYTVDDRQVVQHLPPDEVGWHAGDGSNGPGNRSSLGIEICMDAGGDRLKAEKRAAGLTAWLLEQSQLETGRVVQHARWINKDCPQVLRNRPGGWEDFLEGVRLFRAGPGQPGPGTGEEDDAGPGQGYRDRAIIIGSDVDYVLAAPLARRINAPIFLPGMDVSAREIIVVGGDTPGDIILSGKDRYETAGKVKEFLLKITGP